jgi:plasmid stability protein
MDRVLSALDGMPGACHNHPMANLQVKNLPDVLHERLRKYAQKHHRTISDIALEALEREMARNEWHEQLARRPATDLRTSAASLLEQERQQRESDLP